MKSSQGPNRHARVRRIGRFALLALLWIIASGCTAWAFGALHSDFPMLRGVVAWGFLAAVAAALYFVRGVWKKLAAASGAFVLVLVWWLTQQPSNNRSWQPDVAQLAWAEVKGDEVTLHNIRNCDYNAITTNCTTAIRAQHPARERLPWDWRMLANGKGDAMLFERNMFSTGGLLFKELRKGALINPAAKAADKSADFSNLIREGRPGF